MSSFIETYTLIITYLIRQEIHKALMSLLEDLHNIINTNNIFTKINYRGRTNAMEGIFLRWLKTVSGTFQDTDFDEP